MEYAEQNLAQLLEQRALEPAEVDEMLGPTLTALKFLHDSKRVHGGLKPSNVLVVGEQIKLASDAIGPASDVVNNGGARVAPLSPYQPPEANSGGHSTAGDIWALGVMICEALTRRRPAGLHAMGGGIALPPDIPSPFREMISRCLNRNPEDRPDVAKLQALQKGGEPEPTPAPAPEQDAGVADDAHAATSSTATRLVIRAKVIPPDEMAEPVELRPQWRPVPLIIAAAVLLAIVVGAIYLAGSGKTPPETHAPAVAARAAPAAAPAAPATEAIQAPKSPRPEALASQAPAKEAPPPVRAQAPRADASFVIHEELPVVPRSASQTIRGTIRVAVRVIVDDDGNVVAATSDNPGPSRYFERLSLQAAKKWRFAPAETGGKRLARVRFNYTRSGTTAKASPIQ
jgi:TonB family protein